MDILPQKLNNLSGSLAIFDIGWVTWLMAGFAVGGVAMLLERAICLLMDRFTSDGERWDACRHHPGCGRCPRRRPTALRRNPPRDL